MESPRTPEEKGLSEADAKELEEFRRLVAQRTWGMMWRRGQRLRLSGAGLLAYLAWLGLWLAIVGGLTVIFPIAFHAEWPFGLS